MLSLQALRRLKAVLDIDAPFATVRFAKTADGEPVDVGPTGQPESDASPFQIVLECDVPLQAIRADIEPGVERLRQRHGSGHVERTRRVLGSSPVVAGIRIPPTAIRRMLADGWDESRIMEEYPELTPADIARTSTRRRRSAWLEIPRMS